MKSNDKHFILLYWCCTRCSVRFSNGLLILFSFCGNGSKGISIIIFRFNVHCAMISYIMMKRVYVESIEIGKLKLFVLFRSKCQLWKYDFIYSLFIFDVVFQKKISVWFFLFFEIISNKNWRKQWTNFTCLSMFRGIFFYKLFNIKKQKKAQINSIDI